MKCVNLYIANSVLETMKTFKKTLLKYEYSWTPEKEHDNKWIIGFSEKYMLNTSEGFEVLPFLNRYMRDRNYLLTDTFHKLEEAIKESMPKEVRGHSDVKKWLDHNCCF